MIDAEKILKQLKPDDTTDVETLGLSGAINKRLYEITNDNKYLLKAIRFYSKGFHIGQDHYNGINYAFLLTLKATLQTDKIEAISYFRQSQRIREEIVVICKAIIEDKNFNDRNDKEWVYQSLAQAYLSLNKKTELNKTIKIINQLSKGQFDIETFNIHNKKLIGYLDTLQKKNNQR